LGPAAYDPVKQVPPDTFPVETSERVRCAAMMALQGCLANPDCIIDDEKREDAPPAPPQRKPELTPPTGPDPNKTGDKIPVTPTAAVGTSDEVRQAAYHAALARKPMSSVIRDAQRVLDLVGTQEPTLMTPGNRTLSSVLSRARTAPKPARITAQAPRIAPANANAAPVRETPEPIPLRPEAPVTSFTPRTPAFVPTPTSAPNRENEVQLPKADDEDDLPPLPPMIPGASASAAGAPSAEPVTPAAYKSLVQARPATPAKLKKPVRVAPQPTPVVNPLVDRFSRTPESYRGDIQR
jgi:hypothetical protein